MDFTEEDQKFLVWLESKMEEVQRVVCICMFGWNKHCPRHHEKEAR